MSVHGYHMRGDLCQFMATTRGGIYVSSWLPHEGGFMSVHGYHMRGDLCQFMATT